MTDFALSENFGVPEGARMLSLDDYHPDFEVPDESGVRRIGTYEYASGVTDGRWIRSQQLAARLRVEAAKLPDTLSKVLELLAEETEAGL